MGNRAVITGEDKNLGVYLHWDGSPEQVQGFLAYCDMMGFRSPEIDGYGWAQLIKVIGNYIDDNERSEGLSIGIVTKIIPELHYLNHGVYVIKKWKIIERCPNYPLEPLSEEMLLSILCDINHCQPYQVGWKEIYRYAHYHIKTVEEM